MRSLKLLSVSLFMALCSCTDLSGTFSEGKDISQYEFYTEESNIIGLKSIYIDDSFIEIEINDGMTEGGGNTVSWLKSANNASNYRYHIDGQRNYETAENIEIKDLNDGFIIRMYCNSPETVDSVRMQDITVMDLSSPRITEDLCGGEIVQTYSQSYNADKKKWNKPEYNEEFFPMGEN